MTFTDFIYATGDLFEYSFAFLPTLGNIPNYIIIGIGAIGFIFWLNLQRNYNKAAIKNGTRE